jgi:hypothetical protein
MRRPRCDDIGALQRLHDPLGREPGDKLLSLARGLPAFVAESVGDGGDDVLVGPVNPGRRLFVGLWLLLEDENEA